MKTPNGATHKCGSVFYKIGKKKNFKKYYDSVFFWNGQRWERTFCFPEAQKMVRV